MNNGRTLPSDEAARGTWSGIIARQSTRLAEIRTNAGIVIAAIALVASFLGAQTIERDRGTHALADVALVLLPVSIFFTARSLWPVRDETARGWAEAVIGALPRTDWLVRLSGTQLIWRHCLDEQRKKHDEGSPAARLEGYKRENQKLINRRAGNLMAAISLLVVQAMLWAIALI